METMIDADYNKRGNLVDQRWVPDEESFYTFYINRSCGYEPVKDTHNDAYRQTWASQSELRVISYCEGDVYIIQCPDQEHFDAEIEAAQEFYYEEEGLK